MKSKIKKYISNIINYTKNNLWLLSLVIAITVIIAGLLISTESNRLVAPNGESGSHYLLENNIPIKYLANWDGVDYIHIASSGYDDKFFTGFFPFYALLIKFVHIFVDSYLISGIIISWLSLWGAIYFYMKVIKKYLESIGDTIKNNLTLLKASLYFVLFPSGIYLMCVYTESFYALTALASIYFALSRRIVPATAFLALSVITRVTGFFLIPLIVLILIEEKFTVIKSFITGIIGSIGLIAYMIFLQIKFSNPIEFAQSQTVHHWLKARIWSNFGGASLLDLALVITLIISVIYWNKRRKSFALYSLFFLAIPFIGGQFDGFARYTLMAFPVQIMLFDYFKNKIHAQVVSLVALSSMWTYSVILFAAGFVTH